VIYNAKCEFKDLYALFFLLFFLFLRLNLTAQTEELETLKKMNHLDSKNA